MIVFVLLGFIPGYALSYVLKKAGLLRCSEESEIAGLDLAEVPARAYPKSRIPAFGDGALSPAE